MAASARKCWRIAENAWLCTVLPLRTAQCQPKGANGHVCPWGPRNVRGDAVRPELVESASMGNQVLRNASGMYRKLQAPQNVDECS